MFFLDMEIEVRSSNDTQFFIKLSPENCSTGVSCVGARGVRTYLYSDDSRPSIEPSRPSPHGHVIIIEN